MISTNHRPLTVTIKKDLFNDRFGLFGVLRPAQLCSFIWDRDRSLSSGLNMVQYLNWIYITIVTDCRRLYFLEWFVYYVRIEFKVSLPRELKPNVALSLYDQIGWFWVATGLKSGYIAFELPKNLWHNLWSWNSPCFGVFCDHFVCVWQSIGLQRGRWDRPYFPVVSHPWRMPACDTHWVTWCVITF